MKPLENRIAVVTGASRGVGRGIALGLGEAGATVYVTGRTVEEGKAAVHLSGNVYATAQQVTDSGGKGIAVPCDHLDDTQVERLFQRVREEQGHLDILVNNVWGGYEQYCNGSEYTGHLPFWQRPLALWDSMHQTGVRAHYVASVFAVPLLIARGGGLIANISSFIGRAPNADVSYACAHAAIDRLAENLALALKELHIAAVSLAPGLVRTESVLASSQYFDLTNSESPQFTGRAVAALATDPHIMAKTGQWLVVAELAREYGFTDIDGKQPPSLRA
jgi:dehydrogenase/reductase SDR family member 1